MEAIELGVNIDHVATVRQARGTSYPDPVHAANRAELAGADGITVHLREDRRHIQDRDVSLLQQTLQTRMNLELAVTEEMLEIACRERPHSACLVPERREEVTTEGGLDVRGGMDVIPVAIRRLSDAGIRVALFIDPDPEQIRAAVDAGAPVVELHTGAWAEAEDPASAQRELERIRAAAELGREQGLKVHAGHGLHYSNTAPVAAIPEITELNIGHAIVARAVLTGMEEAVSTMKTIMLEARA